jgi:hypothetical protein
VKLTVPETDDPSMPGLTFRTWVIGTFLCIFLSFVNQFFHFRTAPITISGIAGQMVSLYLGQFMASMLPDWTIGGVRINPGPFNIKVPHHHHHHHLIFLIQNPLPALWWSSLWDQLEFMWSCSLCDGIDLPVLFCDGIELLVLLMMKKNTLCSIIIIILLFRKCFFFIIFGHF